MSKRVATKWGLGLCILVLMALLAVPVSCFGQAPAPAPKPAPTATSATAPAPPKASAPAPAPKPPVAPAPAAAAGKVKQWTFQRMVSGQPGDYYWLGQVIIADLIQRYSNNAIQVNLESTLVTQETVLDAVRDRRIEIGLQGMHYRGELELFTYTSLPQVPYERTMDIFDKLRPLTEETLDKQSNVKLLGFQFYPTQYVFTKKPIQTVEDFKGVKIRATGKILLDLLKLAGAAPATVPYAEIYTSIQRGVIDGAASSLTGLVDARWQEVTKYTNDWPIGSVYMTILMNKDAWNELNPVAQKQLMTSIRWIEQANWLSNKLADQELVPQASKAGVKFITPTDAEKAKFYALAEPILQDWKKRVGARSNEVLSGINAVLGTSYK